MSGTTSNRPQYQLMFSEVSMIRPAVIILWKTDSLTGMTGCDRYTKNSHVTKNVTGFATNSCL